MAWGFFNKIKNGFKKALNFGKKAVNFVNDKIIKPFKPVISTVASTINPAFGAAANVGMNMVDKIANKSNALSWGNQIG